MEQGQSLNRNKTALKATDNSSQLTKPSSFGGARFVYNDKIHIYGGYGFWSFKNFITFFDENVKQWDILYNSSNSRLAAWKMEALCIIC